MTLTANYAHPLRTIGQDLEALHVDSFEMEREGDDYLIRSTVEVPPPEDPLPETNKEQNLRSVLRKMLGRSFEPKEPPPPPPAPVDIELRYTPKDIERLEREGQDRRRDPHRIPDTYSLPQILRAVGTYVSRKGARLCSISMQNQSLTIQYETGGSSRNTEVLTVSSMYDFCVHMYMHRTDR
jgi:hypothetical protein